MKTGRTRVSAMRKKELNEIIQKLELAKDYHHQVMKELKDSPHPQHRETYERAVGRADGLDIALEALLGNQVYLNIWAKS